jgi:hypothetical protein
MKSKLLFATVLVLGLVILVNFAQAPKPWRGIVIGLPAEVEAGPGENVTINGTILNIGWYWLHDFNISVQGLPENYEVKVTPEWFEHLRILREWTPEKGVYLVPEVFTIEIKVPEDSVGVFLVNVTGKEWRSWRRFENSTNFILKVSAPPKIVLSDIFVPENVTEFEPFNISLNVKNEGVGDQSVTLKTIAPEDWSVEPAEQKLIVKANSSEPVVFTLTPTNTSGEISIFMEYPYRKEILNMTKAGPFIVPSVVPAPGIELPTALVSALDFIRANLVVSVIALILVVIIFWNLWQIAKHYKFKKVRGKPEEMVEAKTADYLLKNFE